MSYWTCLFFPYLLPYFLSSFLLISFPNTSFPSFPSFLSSSCLTPSLLSFFLYIFPPFYLPCLPPSMFYNLHSFLLYFLLSFLPSFLFFPSFFPSLLACFLPSSFTSFLSNNLALGWSAFAHEFFGRYPAFARSLIQPRM